MERDAVRQETAGKEVSEVAGNAEAVYRGVRGHELSFHRIGMWLFDAKSSIQIEMPSFFRSVQSMSTR